MARKGWTSLSANYRKRLEKNGISKKDYESGASIQAARGHRATPERPTQASNFPNYQQKRNKLVNRIAQRKQDYFGTSPKWNPRQSREKFRKSPPPMASMRLWLTYTREEWISAIRENPEIAAYLGYH